MILVDTSIWVDHLNSVETQMGYLLQQNQIRMHPYVLGEIALGKLRNRSALLAELVALKSVTLAEHDEVITAISAWSLDGTGIGYVDTHLLVSAKLDGFRLWTRDRRLEAQARKLDLSYQALQ